MEPIRIGILCEGTDWIVLEALTCRILQLPPSSVKTTPVQSGGGSFQTLLGLLEKALHRFCRDSTALVIICADNDGRIDLSQPNPPDPPEDPKHPRHARHHGEFVPACRHCRLKQMVQEVRPQLTHPFLQDCHEWPIVVTVPVEEIEAWLLAAGALTASSNKKKRFRRAEDLPGGGRLKRLLYKKPAPTTEDVRQMASALFGPDSSLDLDELAKYSQSFALFYREMRRIVV